MRSHCTKDTRILRKCLEEVVKERSYDDIKELSDKT